MDGLGIAGLVRIDFLVRGILGESVGEAHLGEGDSLHEGEEFLGAPEAAGGEIEVFGHALFINILQKYAKKSVTLQS